MFFKSRNLWCDILIQIVCVICLVWFVCTNTDHGCGSRKRYHRARRHTSPTIASDAIREVVREVIGIHCNIIDWDTLKTFIAAFPLFAAARMMDEDLQCCFYDRDHHKNLHQFPRWCHDVANWAISLPIGILALHTLFTDDVAYCETNKTFLIGVIFVVSGKVLLKKLNFDFCLRPWHEKFSCVQRASGGFPSGHMAEVTYITLLYGLRYGPKFAIPFGLLAAGVGITFLNCNRHYLSQLIGGAAFGAMYALAANKFVNSKLCENVTCSLSVNKYGGPALRIGYSF
jgi:membrane-associated phospholipid phosphatase